MICQAYAHLVFHPPLTINQPVQNQMGKFVKITSTFPYFFLSVLFDNVEKASFLPNPLSFFSEVLQKKVIQCNRQKCQIVRVIHTIDHSNAVRAIKMDAIVCIRMLVHYFKPKRENNNNICKINKYFAECSHIYSYLTKRNNFNFICAIN